MSTSQGRAEARQCASDRMSDLRMNASDVARLSGVDVKTVRSFLDGERWPQQKSRAAISEALTWPANMIDRLADGTLGVEDALGHVKIGDEHGLLPDAQDVLAARLNGIDRHIDALYARVEELEERLREGGESDVEGGSAAIAPPRRPARIYPAPVDEAALDRDR